MGHDTAAAGSTSNINEKVKNTVRGKESKQRLEVFDNNIGMVKYKEHTTSCNPSPGGWCT